MDIHAFFKIYLLIMIIVATVGRFLCKDVNHKKIALDILTTMGILFVIMLTFIFIRSLR